MPNNTHREHSSLLGQDQLVLAGEAQPVDLAAVMDDDFARSDEEVAAVDLVPGDRDHARRRTKWTGPIHFPRRVDLVRIDGSL